MKSRGATYTPASAFVGLRLGIAILASSAIFGAGCTGEFGKLGSGERLGVTLVSGERGTQDARLPLTFSDPSRLTLKIEAFRNDGTLNTSFNGYVRLSIKPGSVASVTGPNTVGRNVKLVAGVAQDVSVEVLGAYGDARIWAEDMGYFPVPPEVNPPPQCSDGKDNDGDDSIDFPADPGCAFANDDSEDGGTLATGISPTLFFSLPRVADVRGVSQGGGGTSFPHEQVRLDTGYRQAENTFVFNVVVTRIASDGFYVTDLDDPRGYSSIFAFNFSAPARLAVCDRLTSLSGTATDFFGFTELGFPTWGVEPWNKQDWVDQKPGARPCMVPEPFLFDVPKLVDNGTKQRQIASLVRVWTGDVPQPEGADPQAPKVHPYTLHVSSHFGPEFPKAPSYTPTENASNCDLNNDGSVEFSGGPETVCADACTKDVQCAEWSAYATRSNFRLVVHDALNDPRYPVNPRDASVQVNASSSASFNPFLLRGKPLKSFTGTLRFFSGGSQYTIEARCAADIVIDLDKQPAAMDQACVSRTGSDNNQGN